MAAASRPRFAVVTDSSADIAAEAAHASGIFIVPLTVTVGGESLADGVLTQEEFFHRMQTETEPPTTSQPSIGAFTDVYRRALETADEVVSVHISSKLSGTVDAARAAARGFGDKVHVFDSRNLSWALAFQALDAAASAREGASVAEALLRLERVRDEVGIVVGIDSLVYLRKGGRIGAVAAFLGSILNLKVTIAVDAEGSFAPLARTRSDTATQERILAWVEQRMGDAASGRFAVGHALSAKRAEELADAIRSRWKVTELVMYEAGPVILAHAGPIWGVTVWPDR